MVNRGDEEGRGALMPIENRVGGLDRVQMDSREGTPVEQIKPWIGSECVTLRACGAQGMAACCNNLVHAPVMDCLVGRGPAACVNGCCSL